MTSITRVEPRPTSSLIRTRAYVLRDTCKPVSVPLSTLGYREFVAEPDWYRNLISTTSVLWHPKRQRLICGLTSFDTDLLYEFDPTAECFHNLNYPRISEPFEIKIHRSLALMEDGSILGATACLHREDQRCEAPGGRVFRYRFDTDEYEDLGRPVPPEYVQSIDVDHERQLLYGFTYPAFYFFVYDLKQRRVRRTNYVGSIPHRTAVDRHGCVWGTWNNRTHSLFKYDPEADEMHFFRHGLPGSTRREGMMFPGQGPIDMMLAGPDGAIYIGQLNSELIRLDPDTGECESLGRPVADKLRLPAMTLGLDQRIYGVTGMENGCHLFRFTPGIDVFEDLGLIKDHELNVSLFIGHDICQSDEGTFWIGETDTTDRAGYLWACKVPDATPTSVSKNVYMP